MRLAAKNSVVCLSSITHHIWLHGMEEVFSGRAQGTQGTLDLLYADRKLAMILFDKVRGLTPVLRVHKGVT